MPYTTKTERERERWMTLAEAIDWISKQEKCSRREATRQIRAALADNAIGQRHLRWEGQSASPADYPPVDLLLETSIQRGRVFDPWAKRWRTPLILKFSIFQIWPEPRGHASAASESEQAAENDKVDPIPKSKGGRPSARNEMDQALDQLWQQGHRVKDMDPTRVAKLVAKACGKEVGDAKFSKSIMLDEIRIWRLNHCD